jgi:hypothetical protein
MNRPIIYFAGKIGKNDWRHLIVPELRGAIFDGDDAALFNPTFVLRCAGFVYGGPFFVSCDHGCWHTMGKHGSETGCSGERNGRQQIFDVSLARIALADHVFAFIENADAFGTALEIGFAHSLDKPITLGLANETYGAELWMATTAARAVYFGSAEECWKQFIAGVVL